MPQLRGGGDLSPDENRRERNAGGDEPDAAPPQPERSPEADLADDEERRARRKLRGDPCIQRVVRIADGLLESRRDRDDAQEEAVVPVAERRQGDPGSTLLRHVDHRSLDRVLVGEVQPPERGREGQREQGDDSEPRFELEPGGDPDDNDRLAERDDDH